MDKAIIEVGGQLVMFVGASYCWGVRNDIGEPTTLSIYSSLDGWRWRLGNYGGVCVDGQVPDYSREKTLQVALGMAALMDYNGLEAAADSLDSWCEEAS